MNGILYGVGVGPGDPELMTLKAVRLIKENDVMALPGAEPRETVAYRIACAAVPELAHKELVPVYMPMTHDKEEQNRRHEEGTQKLEKYLKKGRNVVFLTLGDPSVYSTFTYIQRIAERDGFKTEMVSGVPSFCAAAARVNTPLAIWTDQIHIFPAVHSHEEILPEKGTCVLMKSGSRMKQVKEIIRKSGRKAVMVENCGTDRERVYMSAGDIPDEAGYYSLIISKERE